jgi:hypothetical protein
LKIRSRPEFSAPSGQSWRADRPPKSRAMATPAARAAREPQSAMCPGGPFTFEHVIGELPTHAGATTHAFRNAGPTQHATHPPPDSEPPSRSVLGLPGSSQAPLPPHVRAPVPAQRALVSPACADLHEYRHWLAAHQRLAPRLCRAVHVWPPPGAHPGLAGEAPEKGPAVRVLQRDCDCCLAPGGGAEGRVARSPRPLDHRAFGG